MGWHPGKHSGLQARRAVPPFHEARNLAQIEFDARFDIRDAAIVIGAVTEQVSPAGRSLKREDARSLASTETWMSDDLNRPRSGRDKSGEQPLTGTVSRSFCGTIQIIAASAANDKARWRLDWRHSLMPSPNRNARGCPTPIVVELIEPV